MRVNRNCWQSQAGAKGVIDGELFTRHSRSTHPDHEQRQAPKEHARTHQQEREIAHGHPNDAKGHRTHKQRQRRSSVSIHFDGLSGSNEGEDYSSWTAGVHLRSRHGKRWGGMMTNEQLFILISAIYIAPHFDSFQGRVASFIMMACGLVSAFI